MTVAKHNSPEWHRTARTVKAQVKRARERGEEITCWRCGGLIPEDAAGRLIFDVGHLNPLGGEGIDNAAPEHRTKTGTCIGNRAHGGRMGAAKTNARRSTKSIFTPPAWA